MAITFKYARIQRADGTLRKAPCIILYGRSANGRLLRILALIDSGADTTVVPRALAEILGLKLGEETITGGIGGEVKACKTALSLIISKNHERYSITIPALSLVDEIDIPLILGRNGFFEEFNITFKQAEEKIVLQKITMRKF